MPMPFEIIQSHIVVTSHTQFPIHPVIQPPSHLTRLLLRFVLAVYGNQDYKFPRLSGTKKGY